MIKLNTAEIDDLTVENVNCADEDTIQSVLDAMEEVETTEPEWAAIEEKCEELLERIEDSLATLRTGVMLTAACAAWILSKKRWVAK